MADFRILGSETTIRLTANGTLQSEITTVKDFSWKVGIKLITEGYLGELANRHREIFEECSGAFAIVPETTQAFLLQQQVYNRARQAGAADVQINIGIRLQFPSGQVFRVTFPDVHFETIGDFNSPARDSFDTMSFSWKSTKYVPAF